MTNKAKKNLPFWTFLHHFEKTNVLRESRVLSVSHVFSLSQVDFTSSSVDVLYVKPRDAPNPDLQSLEELDPDLRRKLERICSRASNFGLKRPDLQLIWDHRLHCLKHHPLSLPKVLSSAPCWDWASLPLIHCVLHNWPPLPPVTALELLDTR